MSAEIVKLASSREKPEVTLDNDEGILTVRVFHPDGKGVTSVAFRPTGVLQVESRQNEALKADRFDYPDEFLSSLPRPPRRRGIFERAWRWMFGGEG